MSDHQHYTIFIFLLHLFRHNQTFHSLALRKNFVMASPPLPDSLPWKKTSVPDVSSDLNPGNAPFLRNIRQGCWLINYKPLNSPFVAYDGTMRVENRSSGRMASGDLYQRPRVFVSPPHGGPLLGPAPDPANGIPVQALVNYRYYLRVIKIDESTSIGSSLELGVQMWRYQGTSKTNFSFTKDPSDYSVTMTWMTGPSGYPSPEDYAEGDLKLDTTGEVAGRLKIGWLSQYYRKCTVEIDTVAGSERPLENGAGQDWHSVYADVGFDIDLRQSDINIQEESGDSWSDAELHKAMLDRRNPINPNTSWHYHILAVKLLDSPAFGIMYDWMSTDSNSVAREGIAIGSDTRTPDDVQWGTQKDKRFGEAKMAYLRTAMHELGHAFGLQHNMSEVDNSFMNRTLTIVSKGTPSNPFPNNIKWNYADENLVQLRHWSDMFVRPGGVEFTYATNASPPVTSAADAAFEVPTCTLSVEPLESAVPLGAPIRVQVTLTNIGDVSMLVPHSLSLKSGYVSGAVTDIAGTTRSFTPFTCYDSVEGLKPLENGGSISASLTLLRGGQGALFPASGVFKIVVRVSWNTARGIGGEFAAFAAGSTTVMVTPPFDEAHAVAAHKLLNTPDTHLVLILGGDHLKEGIDAIDQALKNDALRPHFACIEARRLGQKFFTRPADTKAAAKCLSKEKCVVMSRDERAKLEKLGVISRQDQ